MYDKLLYSGYPSMWKAYKDPPKTVDASASTEIGVRLLTDCRSSSRNESITLTSCPHMPEKIRRSNHTQRREGPHRKRLSTVIRGGVGVCTPQSWADACNLYTCTSIGKL